MTRARKFNYEQVVDRLFEIQGVLRCNSKVLDHVDLGSSDNALIVAGIGRSADLCIAVLDDVIESLEDVEFSMRKTA